tara:strand:+ start:172 stop:729 length:558 start_codon:yes stop_codon:yes gene_type:complete
VDIMSNKTKNLDPTLKELIRNEFVHGSENADGKRVLYTIRDLANKHNLGESTLYRHAQTEGWKAQQDKFQAEYLAELDVVRTKELVEQSKKFDSRSLVIAEQILGHVSSSIKAADSEDKVTPNMLNTLAEATYKIQKVAKLALGESTENMNLNAKITDSTAFRDAMELLDTVAEQRREGNDSSVH